MVVKSSQLKYVLKSKMAAQVFSRHTKKKRDTHTSTETNRQDDTDTRMKEREIKKEKEQKMKRHCSLDYSLLG